MGNSKKGSKNKSKSSKQSKETSQVTEHVEYEQGFLTDVEEYDKNRLALKPAWINPERESTQYNCYPKYVYSEDVDDNFTFQRDGADLVIRTKGPIPILRGGIPSLDGKWRKTDKDRMYFWLCLSISDKDREFYTKAGKAEQLENLEALAKLIKAIDQDFNDEINKKKNKNEVLLLSEKDKKGNVSLTPIDNVKYQRMVRMSPKPKKGQKQYERYERVKVRFSTEWDPDLGNDDIPKIDTVVFDGEDCDEPVSATTPTQVEEHFMWGCSSYISLRLAKVWAFIAEEEDDEGNDCRKGGAGIKCDQIWTVSKPKGRSGSKSKKYLKNVFIKKKPQEDSDNEGGGSNGEEDPSKSKKDKKSKSKSKSKSKKKDSDDEDNNDSSSSDESGDESGKDEKEDDENGNENESDEDKDEKSKKGKSKKDKKNSKKADSDDEDNDNDNDNDNDDSSSSDSSSDSSDDESADESEKKKKGKKGKSKKNKKK